MSNFLVIRGPSGSGKSTVAKLVKEALGSKTAILCPDTFYWDICGKNDDSEIAYEGLHRLTDLYLSRDYHVILEGILSGKDERGQLRVKRLLRLADRYESNLKKFYLRVPVETAIERDLWRGNVVGRENVIKYHEKSLESRMAGETEIDAQYQTPKQISELIQSSL